jgi:Endonuclease-reverse transcriptase
MCIPGYNLEGDLRQDRTDTNNGIGGGLIIYTKLGLAVRKNERLLNINFNQYVPFSVLANPPLNIILVYRPPNSGNVNTEGLCQLIEASDSNTILIGDFNLPDIRWQDENSGPKGRKILMKSLECQMEQLINFSTHSGGNILDLVLTNCADRVQNVSDAGKLGNSDHCIVMVEVQAGRNKVKNSDSKPNWFRADYESIKGYLRDLEWQNILNNDTVEQDWLYFKDVIAYCTDTFVPKKRAHISGRPRWLSAGLVKLIRRKKAAWKIYRHDLTQESLERYRALEKETKKSIQRAKRRLEKDLTKGEDRNGKKFTSYIKSKTKSKTEIGPLRTAVGGGCDLRQKRNGAYLE